MGSTDFLKGELNGALEFGICEVTRAALAWVVYTCRMTVSFVAVERVASEWVPVYGWKDTGYLFSTFFCNLL